MVVQVVLKLRSLPNLYGNFVKKVVFKRKKCRQFRPSDLLTRSYFSIYIIVNKYEIKKTPKCTFSGMKCSKSLRFLGLCMPQTPRGSLRRSPDLLAARGFLPSAIAASRLRRLQFPHGLKSNSVKERWPMRLGGNLRQRSWGG